MLRSRIHITLLFFLAFVPTSFGQATSSPHAEQFLYVTVTNDAGKWIGGMTADNFRLSDGKFVPDITSFRSAEAPVSVGILIDTSGSSANLMDDAYEGLTYFVKGAKKDTEYFVMTFNVTQQLILERTENKDAVLETLKKASAIMPGKNTALFDAIASGLDEVSKGKHEKKALIVFSDAMDNTSKVSFNEIRRRLRRSDVLLYNLNIQDPKNVLSQIASAGIALIDELTSLTGGRAMYPADHRELAEASYRTAEELRYQYKIGFRPRFGDSKVKPDEWRKLELKLELSRDLETRFGKLRARTRRGYYPDPVSVK